MSDDPVLGSDRTSAEDALRYAVSGSMAKMFGVLVAGQLLLMLGGAIPLYGFIRPVFFLPGYFVIFVGIVAILYKIASDAGIAG